MKTLVVSMALALLFIQNAPSPLDTRVGDDVRITAPVYGDLYVAGRNVVIDAPVHGDVVAAGGTVTINDSVTMDVLVAGGRVEVNGHVGDDVRVAGGAVKISNVVEGDVFATSGELILRRTAVLEGNIYASGGSFDIDGDIKGNVKIATDKLSFRGSLNGSLDAKAREMDIDGTVAGPVSIAANEIKIGSDTRFLNDVKFWNNKGSLTIDERSHSGTVTFDPTLEVARQRLELLGFTSLLILLWYLGTVLVMIWLIEYLFSKTLLKAAGVVLDQSLKSLAYGFLYFIAVPVLCVILFISVLGLPIGILTMIGYIILIVLSTAITAIVIANWINRVYKKSSWPVSTIILVAFGIFVLLKLITLTPIVGPLIMIILVCMSFGAIILSLTKKEVV